jgi:hypothetical protein
VVAIWLKREAFEEYLECARSKGSANGCHGMVRLQWDPDHFPNGDRHPYRRAMQLGMKDIESFRNGRDFVWVEDITDFIHSQRLLAMKNRSEKDDYGDLMVASERVYEPTSDVAREAVALSSFDKASDG